MLDVVQTGGLLDRSRTGAFDFHVFSSVEALLHLELRHWALAASYAEKKRPYDDVTGHLKVDNALHPSFLPGRVLPTFQKLQKWQNPRVKAGL